jgi:hypothetical protein
VSRVCFIGSGVGQNNSEDLHAPCYLYWRKALCFLANGPQLHERERVITHLRPDLNGPTNPPAISSKNPNTTLETNDDCG